MRLKYPYLVLILLFSTIFAKGQLIVSFPMEKAVFQRNQNNLASLSVAGSYPVDIAIDAIEARLINVMNEEVVQNWTRIQASPTGGIFSGVLTNVPGGWYRLEIRSVLGGNTINTATLNRVGVGEVFLIAGQSNVQGLDSLGLSANDERVVTHNELTWYDSINGHCDIRFPGHPTFEQLTFGNKIGKTGVSSWCFGKLGDLLTDRLQVPVAFFSAAATSTSSINWMQSSNGLATVNHYNPSQPTFCDQVGVPYANLRITLNYYASIFGARAILWHNGETDNYINTTASAYTSNINHVINKSRFDFGSTIPWVISRATYNHGGDIQQDLYAAQQNLGLDNASKLFTGPDTDVLGDNFRIDGVHFKLNGLTEFANLWNAALDNNFFNNATPIQPSAFPVIEITYSNSNYNLTAPAGYASYKWVRVDVGNGNFNSVAEATTRTISRKNGTYRCYLTSSNGNITFTQDVGGGCPGIQNCEGVTYISDIEECYSSNQIGPIQYDKNYMGTALKMRGTTYSKGIGTHANSEIVYKINNKFVLFSADIGIDDSAASAPSNQSSVVFRIYGDNVLKYESPLLNKSSQPVRINISVKGVTELKLVVDMGPDNFYSDHANWANARLYCRETEKPTAPTSLSESSIGPICVQLAWGASTDNVAVEKYLIYANNVLVDSVDASQTAYFLKNLQPSHYYEIKVRARDVSGNLSDNSNTVEILTAAGVSISPVGTTIITGQAAVLSVSNCNTGAISWSTGSTGRVIGVAPSATTVYSVTCNYGGCGSYTVSATITVLPECPSNFDFTNPGNNFSSLNLRLKASSTIEAQNSVLSNSKITYEAGKSITLKPGFSTTPGTVFKAEINGCGN